MVITRTREKSVSDQAVQESDWKQADGHDGIYYLPD